MSDSLLIHGLHHASLACPLPSPGVCSISCPLSQWCHLTISSSVITFSFPQSFPASGSFPMSWLFASAGQHIGASASASVLPMIIQGWFPLGWTGLISLQSKRLSRVFSSTTVQNHQLFDTQPSLWSNSYIHTWLLEKPWRLLMWSTGDGNGKLLQYPCLSTPRKYEKAKRYDSKWWTPQVGRWALWP